MIKVSVIAPIYNAEKYLNECLESLHQQTLQEAEFILVNDGSTDSSKEICESFVRRDSRFRLLNQENGGSASARRTGMLEAKGEYLGFIDSDDWAEPNMYEKMYSVAKEHQVDIIFCNCFREFVDRQHKCGVQIREGYYNREQIVDEILSRSLSGIDEKGRNRVIRWANYLRLYRRELIVEHQIYNDPRFRRCQDLQITFEATLHAQSYYYMGNQYLYHNRVVENSQSRGYTVDFWKKLRILIEKLYEDVDNFHDVDLKSQMDLCAFFFAVQACSNEGKHADKITKDEVYKNLEEIYLDPLCEKFLKTIPYEKLSKVNQMYFEGLKRKNVKTLMRAISLEERQMRTGQIKSKILHMAPVGAIWRKIVSCERIQGD